MINTRNKSFEYSCVIWRQNSSNSNQNDWQTIPSENVLQDFHHRSPLISSPLSNFCLFFSPSPFFVVYPYAIYPQTRHLEIILVILSFRGVKKHPRGAIIPLRKPPLIPGERIHAFWQRYFSRGILSFVSFSKSHISPSYLISSESLPDGRDCHFDFDYGIAILRHGRSRKR